MPMLRVTEKEFQRTVIEYAHALGYKVYHQIDMGYKDPKTGVKRFSRRVGPGYPDLTIVGHNRILFAELKSEKGGTKKGQVEWAVAIKEAGGAYYLWRPSNWDEIKKILAPAGYSDGF